MFEEEDDGGEGGIVTKRAGEGVVSGGGGVVESFIVVVAVVVEVEVEVEVEVDEEGIERGLTVDKTGGLVVGRGGATAALDGRLRVPEGIRNEREFRTSFCPSSSPGSVGSMEVTDNTSAVTTAEDVEALVHSDRSDPRPEAEV